MVHYSLGLATSDENFPEQVCVMMWQSMWQCLEQNLGTRPNSSISQLFQHVLAFSFSFLLSKAAASFCSRKDLVKHRDTKLKKKKQQQKQQDAFQGTEAVG